MARANSSLVALFEAYGDDAKGAMEALANVDNAYWREVTDLAAERWYRSELAHYRRSLVLTVKRDVAAKDSGQAQLFVPPPSVRMIEVREVLMLDGARYDLASLSGHAGAKILRAVAERDEKPARTLLGRAKWSRRVADHIESETDRLGRDVSVGEVLQLVRRGAA